MRTKEAMQTAKKWSHEYATIVSVVKNGKKAEIVIGLEELKEDDNIIEQFVMGEPI